MIQNIFGIKYYTFNRGIAHVTNTFSSDTIYRGVAPISDISGLQPDTDCGIIVSL